MKIKCADAGTSCESCEDCPYNSECTVWKEVQKLRAKLEMQTFIAQTMTDGLIRSVGGFKDV